MLRAFRKIPFPQGAVLVNPDFGPIIVDPVEVPQSGFAFSSSIRSLGSSGPVNTELPNKVITTCSALPQIDYWGSRRPSTLRIRPDLSPSLKLVFLLFLCVKISVRLFRMGLSPPPVCLL